MYIYWICINYKEAFLRLYDNNNYPLFSLGTLIYQSPRTPSSSIRSLIALRRSSGPSLTQRISSTCTSAWSHASETTTAPTRWPSGSNWCLICTTCMKSCLAQVPPVYPRGLPDLHTGLAPVPVPLAHLTLLFLQKRTLKAQSDHVSLHSRVTPGITPLSWASP